MKENLFSYGTLQEKRIQLELFGRILSGEKETLEGYKIVFVEIKDVSFLEKGEEKLQRTLVESENNSVKGTVFEISTEELLLIDKYEPENYKRIKVTLSSGKKAWIYTANKN